MSTIPPPVCPTIARRLPSDLPAMSEALRVLVVATKAPWPAIDGGRVLLAQQLRGLREAGVRVTLVAPCASTALAKTQEALLRVCEPRLVAIDSPPGPLLASAQAVLRSRLPGSAYSLAKHRSEPAQRLVSRLLGEQAFDLVHVEQLQGLALLPGPLRRAARSPQDKARLPIVVRCQNVESDLWHGLANAPAPSVARTPQRLAWSLARPLLALEARRLRSAEIAWLGNADGVLTVTRRDERRLVELGMNPDRLATLAPPMPVGLSSRREPLAGSPALVLLGSGGWLPNRLANADFLHRVWPRLRADLPGAHLHCFGPADAAMDEVAQESPPVTFHAGSTPTADLFDPTSILVVPLQVGSGIRIKILDAFARRVPVVASPCAAAGLHHEALDALSLADDAASWSEGIQALLDQEARMERVQRGVAFLRAHHCPSSVTSALVAHYSAIAQGGRLASPEALAGGPSLARPPRHSVRPG